LYQYKANFNSSHEKNKDAHVVIRIHACAGWFQHRL